MALAFLKRLLERGAPDGHAAALEEGARGVVSDLAREGAEAAAAGAEAAPATAAIDPAAAALAGKVLEGWLSNRRQILAPHTLNLAALEPGQAALLVQMMATAAQADGEVDAREAGLLPHALRRIGGGEAEIARLTEALASPQSVAALAPPVIAAGLQSHAYAAALLALDRRSATNRAFLAYLARRLGISGETAGTLARRYRG